MSDGAAALAAADGVVRRVIRARALKIFLQNIIFSIRNQDISYQVPDLENSVIVPT